MEIGNELLPLSEELRNVNFGNLHLAKRFGKILDDLLENPGESFPDTFSKEADLEGAYRFFRNDKVDWEKVLAPHLASTIIKASQCGKILAVHDTTDFIFSGAQQREGLGFINNVKNQGFLGHFAMAVSGDKNRIPLGIVGLETYVRKGNPKRTKYVRNGVDKESFRWNRLVDEVSKRLGRKTEVVHIMDSEGDSYQLFDHLASRNERFVIRLCHDRVLKQSGMTLTEALSGLSIVCERDVELSARTKQKINPTERKRNPARKTRKAKLSFTASSVEINVPDRVKAKEKHLRLNVVRVEEVNAPNEEEKVEWRLITTEPIDTQEQILEIVDSYRARWIIEEYFKVLKTGCKYEQRQLESYKTLLVALGLFIPVAHRLLLLRSISRKSETMSAKFVLTDVQLEILSLHRATKLKDSPSARDALLAVAKLGGHIKNNGDPGWLTLWRGYRKLAAAEEVWNLKK